MHVSRSVIFNSLVHRPHLISPQETLRFHPIAHTLIREASQDDVLPLSEPLTLEDGSTSMELPIKKGQVVFTHIYGYQR